MPSVQAPSSLRKTCSILVTAFAAASCGGGGSGGGNQPPVVSARLSGESVLQAITTFDTSGTSDPEGRPTSRRWDYGDGSAGTDDSHVYASLGTFTATYTVTDEQGASATRSVPVTVTKCSVKGTQAAALSPYPTACVQTTLGELVLEVYPSLAPLTVENFLKYVDDGFYAGTLVHRAVPGFVIQGGGFTSGMSPKPVTYGPIPLESNNGLRNWQYTLAMARTSVPDSATSQFFINLVDNFGLDYDPAQPGANGYAVFGQVISGTDVVDRIGAAPTSSVAGFADVPTPEIAIRSMLRMP